MGKWNELPPLYKQARWRSPRRPPRPYMLAHYDAKNPEALPRALSPTGVTVSVFPTDVLETNAMQAAEALLQRDRPRPTRTSRRSSAIASANSSDQQLTSITGRRTSSSTPMMLAAADVKCVDQHEGGRMNGFHSTSDLCAFDP